MMQLRAGLRHTAATDIPPSLGEVAKAILSFGIMFGIVEVEGIGVYAAMRIENVFANAEAGST